MTVYVDDMFLRADVPNGPRQVRGVWCHMFSDSLDPAELHALAQQIGLRRAWFQSKPGRPWHDHYDVTKSRRALAVKAGAVEVDRDRMVEIIQAKRRRLQDSRNAKPVTDIDAPEVKCRPVGQGVIACGPRGFEPTVGDLRAIEEFRRLLASQAGSESPS